MSSSCAETEEVTDTAGTFASIVPSFPPLFKERWLTCENDDERKREQQEIKGQPARFVVRGVCQYRAEHDDGENTRAITGQSRYK